MYSHEHQSTYIVAIVRHFFMHKIKEKIKMTKQNRSNSPELDTIEIMPIVDKLLIVKKLKTLTEESTNIAEYIGDNIHYGRALGYAEGKAAAYYEIAKRIIDGEFDADVVVEDDYEYKM